jgi:hypothetical protein
MRRVFALLLLPAVALGPQSAAMASEESYEGSWKFRVHYDLIGIPQNFPGYTTVQCITQATPFPNISRQGNECETMLQGRFGSMVTWTVNCSDDWEMVQGMGRITYHQGKAQGDVHLQIINPHNSPQMMEFTIEGQRLGPC